MVMFSLATVRGPERGDKVLFDTAVLFAKNLIHQRDVEIDITAQDKGGNFIGNLWTKEGRSTVNLTTQLLEQGLVKIFYPSLDDSAHSNDFRDAEDLAKRNKRNLWIGYDEKAEREKRQKKIEEKNEERKPKSPLIYEVIVTEIVNAGKFYVQIVGQEAERLEELMKNLNADEAALGGVYVPKKGEVVVAKFSEDGLWYRAQISVVNKGDKPTYTVFYVDYGNSETVAPELIRKLDDKYSKLAHQAKLARLAFVIPPSGDEDYADEAALALKEMVWNKTMIATFENNLSDSGILNIRIGDRDSKLLVNSALLQQGLARVERIRDKKGDNKSILEKLAEDEQVAKKGHLGIWQYGDIGSDDEDDRKRPFTKSAPPAKPAATKK